MTAEAELLPEMKATVNPRPSVPKHLMPTKLSRKVRRQLESERAKREEEAAAKAEKEREKMARIGDGRSSGSSNYDFASVRSFEMKGNCKWLKGRRYHDVKGVRYLLPNDTKEMKRLHLQYYVIKWAFQKNYQAPVSKLLSKSGAKVLDVGCGPGDWVVDVAVEFPACEVTGFDMCEVFPSAAQGSHDTSENSVSLAPFPEYRSSPEPEQPPKFISSILSQLRPLSANTLRRNHNHKVASDSPSDSQNSFYNLAEIYVPPNAEWKLGNILEGLPWQENTFEFVHQRMLLYAYTKKQWMESVNELVRVTKCGGYVQLVELDVNLKKMGLKTTVMNQKMIHAIRARDIEPDVANSLTVMLSAAGLVNVDSTFVSIPIGEWGLEIGKLWKENYMGVIQSCKPWLTKSLGMKSKEYNTSWQNVMNEVEEQNTYCNIVVAWGQKPTEGDIVKHWEDTEFCSNNHDNRHMIDSYGLVTVNGEAEGKFADHILRDMAMVKISSYDKDGMGSAINSIAASYQDHGPNFHFEEWKNAENNFAQLEFWSKRMKEKAMNGVSGVSAGTASGGTALASLPNVTKGSEGKKKSEKKLGFKKKFK